MTFTWDFNTATLVAIAAQIVFTIVFIVRTANTANSASEDAREALKLANEAHEKIAAVHGLLALHQTEVARDYVDKDSLRDFKKDFLDAINGLSRRIDEALQKRH